MPTPTETLRKIFKDIANAIRVKDGTTEVTDKIGPETMAERVAAIQTGPDISDATATADDISVGKVAYGADGRIEGALPERTTITVSGVAPSGMQSDGLHISADVPDDSTGIIRSGATVSVISPASNFGTATAVDVLSGKTFTSSSGLKISGVMVPESGPDTSDATATASDIIPGKTAYISSGKVTGSMPVAGSISGELGSTSEVNWSTSDPNKGSGLVSITGVSQTPGYTAGFSNGTLTIRVPANRLLKGRTVTPTTYSQTIAEAEDIAYGAIKVAGDSNLKASNIKSGVSIFGVSGTMSVGTDTSDATATASDIVSGLTAYVDSEKITGLVPFVQSGYEGGSFDDVYASRVSGNIHVGARVSNTYGILYRKGAYVGVNISTGNFGSATAADVAAGKTFTSSAGLMVTGTSVKGQHAFYNNKVGLSSLTIDGLSGIQNSKFFLLSISDAVGNDEVNFFVSCFSGQDSYNTSDGVIIARIASGGMQVSAGHQMTVKNDSITLSIGPTYHFVSGTYNILWI